MCNKMSDVRLSNASPTLGRMDARQPDAVRPPVRRNLFGRPDPGDVRNCVNASIEEDVQRFKDTYNFDPVAERPLAPGNYVWQEDRNAPEFYSRAPHSKPPRRDDELPGSESSRSDTEERSDRPPEQQDGSRKRRSGSCSDECQSKRSHTDEDDDDDDDGDEDHSAGSEAGEAAEEEEEEEEKQ